MRSLQSGVSQERWDGAVSSLKARGPIIQIPHYGLMDSDCPNNGPNAYRTADIYLASSRLFSFAAGPL